MSENLTHEQRTLMTQLAVDLSRIKTPHHDINTAIFASGACLEANLAGIPKDKFMEAISNLYDDHATSDIGETPMNWIPSTPGEA